MADSVRQEILDRYYHARGPCCAGCDWWRHLNAVTGECTRSAYVSGADRMAGLGIDGCSLPAPVGHALTERGHVCGEFRDGFDWASLPAAYRRRIGLTHPPPPVNETPGVVT